MNEQVNEWSLKLFQVFEKTMIFKLKRNEL